MMTIGCIASGGLANRFKTSWLNYDLSSISFDLMSHWAFYNLHPCDPADPRIAAGYRWEGNSFIYDTSGWTDADAQLRAVHDEVRSAGKKLLVVFYEGVAQTGGFFDITGDPALLAEFVSQVREFLIEYDYDGVMINWENRDSYQGPLNVLMEALYNELHPAGKLVSCHGSHVLNLSPSHFHYTDFISINAYDFKGTLPYYETYEDATALMELWGAAAASVGYPKNKLVMGINLQAAASTGKLTNWWQVSKTLSPLPGQNDAYIDNIPNWWGTEIVAVPEGYLWWNGIQMTKDKCQYVKNNGYGGIKLFACSHDSWEEPYCQHKVVHDELKGNGKIILSLAAVGLIIAISTRNKFRIRA